MDARYYSLHKIAASNKNLRVYVVTWDARPEAWLNDALRHPTCISTDINAEHRGRGVALWRKRERSTFEPSSLRLFFSFFSLPVLFLSFFTRSFYRRTVYNAAQFIRSTPRRPGSYARVPP